MPRAHLQLGFAVVVLVVAFGVAGCVIAAASESRYQEGPFSDLDALEAIEPDQTTKAWVLENLGPPASTYTNDAGNEVLRYVSVKERETAFHFFFLFAFGRSDEEITTMHIEFESGRVKSYWID